MGSIIKERNPNKLVAHAIPSLWYTAIPQHLPRSTVSVHLLWTVNNGNIAPNVYRTSPPAATAEAPVKLPYTSTMYSAPAV